MCVVRGEGVCAVEVCVGCVYMCAYSLFTFLAVCVHACMCACVCHSPGIM